MDVASVGNRISQLRKEKGYTQKELAQMLNVTDGAVSKWERGLNYPDLSIMEPLAGALAITVAQLLSLESVSAQEAIVTVTKISEEEKKQLIMEIKKVTIRDIVYGFMILAAFLCASKIFDSHHIYGLAQAVTLGMCGFVGTLIGSEFLKLRKLSKLMP